MLRHLEWDTNFFGFKVGQITASSVVKKELQKTFDTIAKHKYRLVYWQIKKDNHALNEVATKYKGKLVDEKTTYSMNLGEFTPNSLDVNSRITEYQGYSPTVEMEQIALECGAFSRFNHRIDSNFSEEQFNNFYIMWIKNSVAKIIADKVFVYSEEKRVSGLITLRLHQNKATIGLIGVCSLYRGKNIGTLLVNFAYNYLKNNNYSFLNVVTQKRNISASLFYQKCGFKKSSTDNFYHFWQ